MTLRIEIISLFLAILLIATNFVGILNPADYRKNPKIVEFSKDKIEVKRRYMNNLVKSENPDNLINYNNALSYMDKAFQKYGKSFKFIEYSTKIWHNSVVYSDNPKDLKRVKFSQNWVFFLFEKIEFLKKKMSLDNHYNQFSNLQTNNYKQALRRAFGICSQSALAYSDMLQKRYKIKSQIAGMQGHVVTVVKINNNEFITDPSTGISFNFSFIDLYKNKSLLKKINKEYDRLNFNHNKAYDKWVDKKIVLKTTHSFNPNPYERISEYLNWLVPFILLIFSIVRIKNRKS